MFSCHVFPCTLPAVAELVVALSEAFAAEGAGELLELEVHCHVVLLVVGAALGAPEHPRTRAALDGVKGGVESTPRHCRVGGVKGGVKSGVKTVVKQT